MATPTTELEADSGLELSAAEREILAQEVGAFAGTLRDPDSRERYARLDEAVQQGMVPAPLLGFLETMLELLLQTQRVRRQQGPEAEQALVRLWQRTPRGAGLKAAAQEVNEALGALRGQAIEAIAFSPTPRGHSLVLETHRCRLTLSIDRAGVRVDNMEIGG